MLCFFVFVAIFAPLLAPYPPKADRTETITAIGEPSVDEEQISEEHPNENEDILGYRSTTTKEYQKHVKYFPLRSKPSTAHFLGTDQAGNDLFSQLIWGTRTSLMVGLVTGLFVTFVALTLALVSGYLGGVVDDVISFITNVMDRGLSQQQRQRRYG